MIKLTEYYTGDEVWVNPLLVRMFRLNGTKDGTYIVFVTESIRESLEVKELPEEINRLFNL